jgi:hypothetical protein
MLAWPTENSDIVFSHSVSVESRPSRQGRLGGVIVASEGQKDGANLRKSYQIRKYLNCASGIPHGGFRTSTMGDPSSAYHSAISLLQLDFAGNLAIRDGPPKCRLGALTPALLVSKLMPNFLACCRPATDTPRALA